MYQPRENTCMGMLDMVSSKSAKIMKDQRERGDINLHTRKGFGE